MRLQDTEEVLDCLRASNVAARWLMLHVTARHPRLAPAVAAAAPRPAAIVSFVMDTALLEFEVRCCKCILFYFFLIVNPHLVVAAPCPAAVVSWTLPSWITRRAWNGNVCERVRFAELCQHALVLCRVTV